VKIHYMINNSAEKCSTSLRFSTGYESAASNLHQTFKYNRVKGHGHG